ncbi:Os04g0331650 [Oryza sativa Japonica Group]|uniref:Os04g0331650 protein n=1 Tax=Oryza sativa subsp. japonica TaxID=39947 RepID=C7J1N4_ORYSJ|nr:Os04g0331650 [Oryza sativa Japonica Group]|eukprot:NP_001173874.1 Os04g0331650 [Oryza sativa Japonica Group]
MLQWPLNPAKLVVPLVLQAPAMDNIYTSRKPLHVPLNISFWVHALYACYAKPNVCECDPYAAKLNHLNKADEDKYFTAPPGRLEKSSKLELAELELSFKLTANQGLT